MAAPLANARGGRPTLRLFGSRLVFRIALALFLSLLAIGAAIFFPSYVEKERDLLSQIELQARSALYGIASGDKLDLAGEIAERRRGLLTDTPIRGMVIYHESGEVRGAFGEAVELRPSTVVAATKRLTGRTSGGARFDVLWTADVLDAPFRIAGRLDSSHVGAQLHQFSLRIVSLVLLIALLVTVILTIVLKKMVLTPALAAHRALLGARADFSRADEWTISGKWDGEIGELTQAVNEVLQHVSQAFRLVRTRNDALTKEAEARRRAEEEAGLAHTRLIEAIEAFPGGFAVFDSDDRLTLYNRYFKECYPDHRNIIEPGVKFEELLRVGVATDRSRGDYRRDEEWIEARLRQHWSGDSDIERRLSSGRWIRITERRTQEGGVLGVFMDISELKWREEALGASEAKFRSVAESSNDALIVTTEDGTVIFWNGAAERLTGYLSAEIVGTPMARIVLPERLAGYRERYDLIRSGRESELVGKLFESEIRSRSGEVIPVEISFSIWSDGDTKFVTRALRDIRDRRKAREESQRLQAQLFQAQKNEALGTLAGGIAHDFNNLLAIILGNARLLEAAIPPGTAGREELNAIIGAGDRAKNVVKQILSFARRDPTPFDAVDLVELANETLSLMRATLPQSIRIETRMPDVAAVQGDATQMHQIIMNLCLNARDAIGDRPGEIAVEVTEDPPDEPWPVPAVGGPDGQGAEEQIVVRSEGDRSRLWMGAPQGRHVRLEIGDTGCGMDGDTLARIFDPFFTTKDIGKGTGLGLAAVRGIVLTHRGAIHVDSAVGEGTRVVLHLPRAGAPATADMPAAPMRLHGRVLLLDDDPKTAATMQKTLREHGYEVDVMNDAVRLFVEVRKAPRRWDVLVFGPDMAAMSGAALVTEIHAIRPDMPTILCAGSPEDVSDANAATLSAPTVIANPSEDQDLELVRVIQRMLQHSTAERAS